ncbi:MAG: hypothetical protein KKD63_16635 [Proteobacteria bacterium]|nr:hypothetical protein [Pseudomonadota bacterium]
MIVDINSGTVLNTINLKRGIKGVAVDTGKDIGVTTGLKEINLFDISSGSILSNIKDGDNYLSGIKLKGITDNPEDDENINDSDINTNITSFLSLFNIYNYEIDEAVIGDLRSAGNGLSDFQNDSTFGLDINQSTHIAVITGEESLLLLDLNTNTLNEYPITDINRLRSVAVDKYRNIGLVSYLKSIPGYEPERGVLEVQLPNPVPELTSITPSGANVGDPGCILRVTGDQFITSSSVQFNQFDLDTSFSDNNTLDAVVPSTLLSSAGIFPVTVTNPSPAGGISNGFSFLILNPVPSIVAIDPSQATAGTQELDIDISGTGFTNNTIIYVNGIERSHTLISATEIKLSLTSADLETGGDIEIKVSNPAPGGGTASAIVTIIYPPAITVLEPDGINDNADTSFTIKWTDADPDSNATISLYYGTDNRDTDGTLIVSGLSEDPDLASDDSYIWNTAQIVQGEYYIYAVIDDGVHAPVTAYSEGVVNIAHSLQAETKHSPGDAEEEDLFGQSVAINGDTAIMGAPHDDDGGYLSGSAYIYKRAGETFIQQAKLIADDAAAYDHFGNSVAISGDTVIVGAYGNDDGCESSGAAYIFKRDGDVWTQQAKLTAGDGTAYDYFGWSVAIIGDTAIVGAYGDDDGGESSGAAYIFKLEGATWTQISKLTANDAMAYDYFGYSVALDSGSSIVGAWGKDDNGSESGAAYIFDSMGEQTKLMANDGHAYDFFGFSVSICGNHAIVGAYGDDDGGIDSGAAYIFSSASPWKQRAKLTGSNAGAYAYFGYTVVIGSITGQFPQLPQLVGDLYAAVGAPGYNTGSTPSGTGAMYMYRGYDTLWLLQNVLSASNAASGDRFGSSIGISNGDAIVGAPKSDIAGLDSGSAYIFSLCNVKLIASPEIIRVGASSALTWDSTNADSLSIDPGIGALSAKGSQQVSPQQTTTYTITATGHGGTSTDKVTIHVIDPSVPPAVEISANTDSIYESESIVLTWNSSNADTCVIAPNIGSVALSGCITVSPAVTTAYTITSTGPAGTATATVTVVVNPRPSVGYEEFKLTAEDAAADDQFGNAVAISGDYAIAGSPGNDEVGEDSGSAYIFKREGTIWRQQAKLTASDAGEWDYFGYAVSIFDDYAMASGNEAVYIFKREGSVWTEQAKLTAGDTQWNGFGGSISVYGDYAIIGAPIDYENGSWSGAAYIFKRENNTWRQQAKLTASDAGENDEFGNKVSIYSDYAIIGNRAFSGSAYIFKREGATWTQQAKLYPSDKQTYDNFGCSVAISADTAIVGASGYDDVQYHSGAAYLFMRAGMNWVEAAKLIPETAIEYESFGGTVSISNDFAIISTYFAELGGPIRSVYIFKKDGPNWTQHAKFTASDAAAYDEFGYSVAISGDTAIVGAPDNDDAGSSSGSAYIYKFASTTVNITAVSDIIQVGGSSTLNWSSANADGVIIDQGIGSVSADGSLTVTPQQTTTYTITATGSGGTASKSVIVYVVDPAIPPVVGISANPATIMIGETFTLSWSASNTTSCVIEPGIGSVALSGSMPISLGATTTYTITATGPAGTATSSVTVYANALVVPTVALSATPEVIQAGGSTTLNWSSTNAVSVVIEPGIGSVALSGSMALTPAGTTTYMIKATGPGGTATSSVKVTVPSELLLSITSPSNSATINRPDVMVTGIITNAAQNDVGVTVNGVGALVSGNLYVANHVPLTEGENTIIATATAADGVTAEASIIVNASYTGANYITITADPESGGSPLQTDLEVSGTVAVTSPAINYTGPGTATITPVSDNEYKAAIHGQGIYFFTAEVLFGGSTYTDTVAVQTLDPAILGSMLKAKWNGMRMALINSNIEGALNYFHESSKDKYREIFNVLINEISGIASTMRDIEMVSSKDMVTKFRIKREDIIQGQAYDITYHIYFVKGPDGLWKIESF